MYFFIYGTSLKTLENYVLSDEKQVVTLKQDEIETLTFEKEKIKGFISVTKYSSDNNKYAQLEKGVKLEGAEFEIYDENNNLVDTIVTDETGFAISKELLKGKYTIKEIKAPLYYVINENTFQTEIVNHQETVNIDITDDNIILMLKLKKLDLLKLKIRTIFFIILKIFIINQMYL